MNVNVEHEIRQLQNILSKDFFIEKKRDHCTVFLKGIPLYLVAIEEVGDSYKLRVNGLLFNGPFKSYPMLDGREIKSIDEPTAATISELCYIIADNLTSR